MSEANPLVFPERPKPKESPRQAVERWLREEAEADAQGVSRETEDDDEGDDDDVEAVLSVAGRAREGSDGPMGGA